MHFITYFLMQFMKKEKLTLKSILPKKVKFNVYVFLLIFDRVKDQKMEKIGIILTTWIVLIDHMFYQFYLNN